MSILSSSCHVMSYHVVLTPLSCVTKFFYHTFFFPYFGLIVVIIMSLLNVRSYSLSHHTCHHNVVISRFFFYYYHRSCCSVLLHNTRGAVRLLWPRVWFPSLCAVMKLRIKKILTDFCDTCTHFAALARACFHESHVWVRYSCEYAAHMSKNASHIATLALGVPFPVVDFFFFC
jgi:hypothetical protein